MTATAPATLADPTSQNPASSLQAVDSVGALHKRTYQACIPCRRRKVRCDLGPVDDPHNPPCVRCRRESKECFFSVTRRKRRADSEEESAEVNDIRDDTAAQNGRRKSARARGSLDGSQPGSLRARNSVASGSIPSGSPLDRYNQAQNGQPQNPVSYVPDTPYEKGDDIRNQDVTNETAAILFQSPINNPGDALHLLLQASGQSEDIERRDTAGQSAFKEGQFGQARGTTSSPRNSRNSGHLQQPSHQDFHSNLDPAITSGHSQNDKKMPSEETLAIWARLRFVRAGWFTAREAVLYIDYFYQYLAPLTPIHPPDFRLLDTHKNLLNQEPMLTVTLLAIASRCLRLSGPAAQTRSYMVHDRLWIYLQNMITRMFWGQEQFGVFGPTGPRRKTHGVVDKGRLRTLGTIESLLLLSDFHPRSIHFPPSDDDDGILAPTEEDLKDNASTGGEAHEMPASDSTFAGWTESALRSDRMSWSLIGTSYGLAYELGIFGNFSDGVVSPDRRLPRQGGSLPDNQRVDRIQRLLYIYITHASGRFGFPSMYPDHINAINVSHVMGRFDSADSMIPRDQDPIDVIQQLWVEVASILKATNDDMFPSKDATAKMIQNGEYMRHLQRIQPVLRSWQRKFEQSNGVKTYQRLVLSIEFHYCRLYINSLALQAVLEQWTTKVGAGLQSGGPQSPESTTSSAISGLYTSNEYYIKEVVDAARTLLRHVVDGLLPSNYLKHAPVRTYFRIVSAAMFLLKTFALGAKKDEVDISLHLLDQTVHALRTSVVDDVHLSLRIADLLEGLTSSIRPKFVRFAPRATDNTRRAASELTDQSPAQYSLNDLPKGTGSQFFNQRYVRQAYTDDTQQDQSACVWPDQMLNQDSNSISIMPPPRSIYNDAVYDFNSPTDSIPYAFKHQQQMPYSNNMFSIPSEADWMTLDLQPLLDSSNLSGADSQWLGPLGPETHNNLEVLGKLVNDQGAGDGFGINEMGF